MWRDHLHLCTRTQESLEARVGPMHSLSPDRETITPLPALLDMLLTREDSPDRVAAFAQALCTIGEAQVENFPESLFWDMDFVAASLLRSSTRVQREASEIKALGESIVALQGQFGRHSVLCFRYTHDFLYGYDWARWVARDPSRYAGVGPFEQGFLTYLSSRGEELEALIAKNDLKYNKLPSGTPRNPFSFSRSPDHEGRLLQSLAAEDCIPVRTWDIEDVPRWDSPFADIRKTKAEALGIPTRASEGDA